MPKSKLEQSIENDEKALAAEEKSEASEGEATVEEIEETIEDAEEKSEGKDDKKVEKQTKEKGDGEDDNTDDSGSEDEKSKTGGGEEGKSEEAGNVSKDTGEGEKEAVLAADIKGEAYLKRENRRLKAQLAAKPSLERSAEAKTVTDPEPNRGEDPDAWRDWKIRDQDKKLASLEPAVQEWRQAQDYQKAGEELNGYISAFSKEVTDCKTVLDNAAGQIMRSFKVLNPTWSETQVQAAFGKYVITQGAIALSKGIDPAEWLYDKAIEQFGRPEPAKAVAADSKTSNGSNGKTKPNLAKIDASRRKSATPLIGGGQGSENTALTKAGVAAMPLHEFALVDPKVLEQLEMEAD